MEDTAICSQEKKRRRWGVFMGRAGKGEVRSATLGRDRAKPPPPQHRWSTGPPRQPLPPSITKETLCQLLERQMSTDQIAFAFERVAKGRAHGASAACALLPAHAHLAGPAPPYDDTRVRLRPDPANPHGYINASHVTMTVGSSQRFYVVIRAGTGAPPAGATPAASLVGAAPGAEAALVWQCVWQVGARLVAYVGDATRPHYLPDDDETKTFGQFQVSVRSVSAARWGASARVRVRSGGRARDVWHAHYRAWPAAAPAPPDTQLALGFLSELNALRASCSAEAASEAGSGATGAGGALWPLAVCCARGAGRAGSMLAADLLLHILDNNQELDIPRTVSLLHQQRAGLIENHHQYRFLHQLLLDYLKQSRLI